MKIRNVTNRNEALDYIGGKEMKFVTLDDTTIDILKAIPYVFGEPVMSDYTFGPALTWVLTHNDIPFVVCTDFDSNWEIDCLRSTHWIKTDEFIFELVSTLTK